MLYQKIFLGILLYELIVTESRSLLRSQKRVKFDSQTTVLIIIDLTNMRRQVQLRVTYQFMNGKRVEESSTN
jgi:hypothetical protein